MVSAVFSIPLDAQSPATSTPPGSQEGPWLLLREYIGGRENSLAREAVAGVLQRRISYNPLLFYGPSSAGKSLLLWGLTRRWKLDNPDRSVLLSSGADFARAYAHAVDTDGLADFRRKHRGASLLAIDDLDDLDGKRAAQLELARTVDALLRQGSLFWAAARRAPGEWTSMAPALTSRLLQGLTVPLQPPCAAARRLILERLAELHGLRLFQPVVDLLVHSSSAGSPLLATPPQLNHALLQLAAESGLQGRTIDVDLARRVLSKHQAEAEPTLRAIMSAVSRYFDIAAAQLKGPTRRREAVRARGVAILLTRRLTSTTLEDLGQDFGGRDHSTVLHACRKTEKLLKTDAGIRQAVNDITKQLTAR